MRHPGGSSLVEGSSSERSWTQAAAPRPSRLLQNTSIKTRAFVYLHVINTSKLWLAKCREEIQ